MLVKKELPLLQGHVHAEGCIKAARSLAMASGRTESFREPTQVQERNAILPAEGVVPIDVTRMKPISWSLLK